MAKWSALVTPLLDWPPAGQARSIENARSSATEACQRRVEREEVAAYLLARAAVVPPEDKRMVHSR
jgi:hypothetical protein